MTEKNATSYILVDCESTGPTPFSSVLTEFAAIDLATEKTFYARLWDTIPHPDNPALPVLKGTPAYDHAEVFTNFKNWLDEFGGRVVFVSDNPGFDFMWIAYNFDQWVGSNPFGYSSRRIGDLAAGFSGNWKNTQGWKKHRKTEHDHDPRNDVRGNMEALRFILDKYEQKY